MKSNVIKSGLLFILVSLSFPALSQDFFEQAFDSSKAYILLVHPSKNIIQAVDYLRKNKLLKIKDTEFVGVYHEQEKYDFQQAIDYVRDEKIEGIHFERISPFSPPQSFHQHLDKESYRFLDRYWKFIARSIRQAGKARISMN